MSVTLRPATLLLAALAIAGAASGLTVVVMRSTTPPCVATTTPVPGTPSGVPTDAERDAADRRARARTGNAATGGRSF